MKKLFLLMVLAGVSFAGSAANRTDASVIEATQAAQADVYSLDKTLVILPEYNSQEGVTILKNGVPVSWNTDWSVDAQPFNFDVQPSGTGSVIMLVNKADRPDDCWGFVDVYINSGSIYVGRVYVNKVY